MITFWPCFGHFSDTFGKVPNVRFSILPAYRFAQVLDLSQSKCDGNRGYFWEGKPCREVHLPGGRQKIEKGGGGYGAEGATENFLAVFKI